MVFKPTVKSVSEDAKSYEEISEEFQKISRDGLGIDARELQGFLNKTFVNGKCIILIHINFF